MCAVWKNCKNVCKKCKCWYKPAGNAQSKTYKSAVVEPRIAPLLNRNSNMAAVNLSFSHIPWSYSLLLFAVWRARVGQYCDVWSNEHQSHSQTVETRPQSLTQAAQQSAAREASLKANLEFTGAWQAICNPASDRNWPEWRAMQRVQWGRGERFPGIRDM